MNPYYKNVWVVVDEYGSYRKAFPTKKSALEYCKGRYSGKQIVKYTEVKV
jgi:hypothetical protein